MPDEKNITEERYLTDRHDTIEQLAEILKELRDQKECTDKLRLESFIQKWTSRTLIAILLAIGVGVWEILKAIGKYIPALIKLVESSPKK